MKTIRNLFARVREDLRARWAWYRLQRRVPRERRWWDAYNS